jgi:hypothetical protein
MILRRSLRFSSTLLACALIASIPVAPAGAAKWVPPKKTVTYSVKLTLDGRTVVGPFASTETVTATIRANPTTGDDPTAWEGTGDLSFGPIITTGLPAGCELTTVAPTGTMRVALIKQGDNVEVTWSSNTSPIVPSVLTCKGQPAPFIGGAQVEPFVRLEPKTFTVAATGGSQQLKGSLVSDKGLIENIGTMTVTRREECGQKVKAVNTYPPGQTTTTSSMVGRAFGVGEKVTADTNVEFVFEDGSIMRLVKGAAYKETPACDAGRDTSKSYKGTLLLGKIWSKLTSVFGDRRYEWNQCYDWGTHKYAECERTVTGRRGTTFWVDPSKKRLVISVSEGSVWVDRRTKSGKFVGQKIIVKAGRTLILSKKRPPVLRRTRPADAFPFG